VHQSDIAAAGLPEGPGLIGPTWPSRLSPASKTDRDVVAHWPRSHSLTAPFYPPKTRAPAGFKVCRAFRDPWQGLALKRLCRDRGGRDPQQQQRQSRTRMTKRMESKYKIDRRMGENIWGRPKSPVNRREYGPGQHGQRRKSKLSDYGVQLKAKQKLRG